jgi:hypothetical protein
MLFALVQCYDSGSAITTAAVVSYDATASSLYEAFFVGQSVNYHVSLKHGNGLMMRRLESGLAEEHCLALPSQQQS